MRTALVIGGAACVWDDIAAYKGPIDGVVACNDVGAEWSGELDAWASLHPNKFPGWLAKREANGFPKAKRLFGWENTVKTMRERVDGIEGYKSPLTSSVGSGSSGLYAAEVARFALGFDRVVFCGVPLSVMPHFFDASDWHQAERFQRRWIALPDAERARMRSMSGWTRVLLGAPDGV